MHEPGAKRRRRQRIYEVKWGPWMARTAEKDVYLCLDQRHNYLPCPLNVNLHLFVTTLYRTTFLSDSVYRTGSRSRSRSRSRRSRWGRSTALSKERLSTEAVDRQQHHHRSSSRIDHGMGETVRIGSGTEEVTRERVSPTVLHLGRRCVGERGTRWFDELRALVCWRRWSGQSGW